MGAVPRGPMTLPEFLRWEELQEERYEFDGSRVVAMADVTVDHDTIGGTLRALLLARLRGSPCRARGPTLKVELAGRIRYPDAFIYCGELPGSTQVVTAPVVVFEILSADMPTGERESRRHEYQAAASVQRYIVLERDEIAATEFARENSLWAVRSLRAGDALPMPEVGIEIGLAEIYADVDWLEPEAVSERSTSEAVDRLVVLGRERGYVTYDELNVALPQDQVSSEQIETTMTRLSELAIDVIETQPAKI
jgi:Uma2 family endonuclease